MASAVWRDRQPFVLAVRSRMVANVLSIGFELRTCFPVLGGEGEQRRAILGQAGDGLVVLRPELARAAVEGSLGSVTAFRLVDGVEILLRLAVHGLGQDAHVKGGVIVYRRGGAIDRDRGQHDAASGTSHRWSSGATLSG
jgi:hypothetical protein